MLGKKLIFTLWEDDANNEGHNANNQIIETLPPIIVDRNGIATGEFTLTKALMQKALKGEADPKQLEFYVTVEYYKNKKHTTENVEVNNPFPPSQKPKQQPVPTSTKPSKSNTIPKAKGSPAEQKPPSKKEEKGIGERIIETGKELWDWWESKGTATKDQTPTIQKPEGKSPAVVKEPKQEKKDNECLCKRYDLVWGDKIGCNERKKVVEVAKNLGVDPNWLMTVMALETAKTFSPAIDNGIGYVGLIQFGKDAAETVGTTQERLVKMSFIEQMGYVQKHLMPKKEKYKTLTDLYLAVLYPKACGHGSERDYVVLHGAAYRNNPLFFKEKGEWEYITKINKKGKKIKKKVPTDPDGNTYVWEIAMVAQELYTEGLLIKETEFSCGVSKEEKANDSKCPEDYSQCFEYADVIPNPRINNQSDNANKNRFHREKRYNSTHPKGYYHTGTDILSGGKFVEIHSLLCGEVIDTVTSFKSQEYKQNSMGNTITIKSKDKEGKYIWIIYCHLDSVKVKVGQKVKHNQVIGISGCTGNAGLKPNGSRGIEIKYWHVHIEASRENKFYGSDKRVDAEQFMKTKFDETTKGNPIKK